ncbi:MAG: hypothetical protein ACI83W_002578 [Marinoscillum sp.]|jgi:hypothetical protein
MKRFIKILMCILLNSYLSNAQGDQDAPDEFLTARDQLDSMMSDLDKSLLQTDILYDRVVSFAQLEGFNDRQDTSHATHFQQAWSELYRSSFKPRFGGVDVLDQVYDFESIYDHTDIGLVYTTFDKLDKSEGQTKWKAQSGKIKSNNGQNPFVQEEILLASPLLKKVWGSSISFHLKPQHLMLGEGSKGKIKAIQIDFGDGEWRAISLQGKPSDQNWQISYNAPGEKIISTRLMMKDGSELLSRSRLEVSFTPSRSGRIQSDNGTIENRTVKADIAFQGYNESSAVRGKAEYRIFFHTSGGNTSANLIKPIIIIDGFDPLDKRKIETNDDGHNPDGEEDFKSIYELMQYSNSNLVDVLQADGFDVVIVNLDPYTADENGQQIVGGGDYIERNAMTLIKLIQELKAEVTSNGSQEDLVIVGPSMGGLISRYALAYMEKHNMPHHTRLWVSFDSPHLGANIPIAVHQMLYHSGHFAGQQDSKKTFDEELQSPAAKQMLIDQLQQPLTGNIYEKKLSDQASFRQSFMSTLNNNGISGSNGFPMNLRKISLINGTTLGSKINSDGQRFIDFEGKKFGATVVAFRLNFKGAANQSIKTYDALITSLFFIGIGTSSATSYTTHSDVRGNMDVVPGAYFNTGEIINRKIVEKANEKNVNITKNNFIPNHSFIPTVSSLAFKNSNFNWNSSFERSLTCNNEIPFDSYFAPATNEEHITLTQENVDWVLAEINGNPQVPVFRLSTPITGSQTLCSSNSTYQIANPIPNSVVTWSVSPTNLFAVDNGSGNSFTTRAEPSVRGKGTITATIARDCGNV